ncbi:hypothetical protein JAAARDRAFT_37058 [Jaapia argillacea MUCL 33604]|uniref:Uncharacterized protein n=1 Tax=Jaapia argillacea MUCL 33604 TaxID=933084 RepID=A0A067PWK4_9AGAM|nr:hypothetical protein JAAARDRAFT_37058 [Jaapia argillacea MUCL 33604]
MTADHPTHPDQVESLSEFLHALSKLSGLEVFLLYGHYACHPSSLWWTIWDNNWTTVDRVHIFVKACPSLRLVLTPVSRDEWDAVAYERDADQQMKLVPLDWMDNYFPSVLFSLDCHNTTLRTMLQHWLHP